MDLFLGEQVLQFAAWFLAYIEFVLALYILLLNAWHLANRHVSLFLLLLAGSNFAMGAMVGASDVDQAALPTAIMAAVAPAIQPGLLLVIVALLKPQWLQGRRRYAWWLVYGLALLPAGLTLVDLGLGTDLWYTGLDAETYDGGFAAVSEYATGSLAEPLNVLNFYVLSVLPFIPLLYLALRDKALNPLNRRLAWLFMATQLVIVGVQLGLQDVLSGGAAMVITNVLIVLVYAPATFRQMVSERRKRRGRLQTRLSILVLGIALPLMIAVLSFLRIEAAESLTQAATERLDDNVRALKSNVSLWLDLNDRALQTLVSLPDVVSMDPEKHKTLVKAMAETYPHMYLVSTTTWEGQNVARSDALPLEDYGMEPWLRVARNARLGDPLTLVVSVDEARQQPVLVAARPIRNEMGTIMGVAMFASTVADLAQEVLLAGQVGETGLAFIVDDQNRVVAHSDPTFSVELQDFDTYPPVFFLRGEGSGATTFTDDQGRRWRAAVDELENGWGLVVQQQEREFLVDLNRLSRVTWVMIGVTALVLSTVIGLTIRQSFRPISALTDTATAIAKGDLSRTAPVESEDEIGLLARTFNIMTDQLRGLISGLEEQVVERTQDLERRSRYLAAAAEVGRVVASILDQDQLISEVVGLILDEFELYYVGLFLTDEAGEWAVLRAGTGEAGRAMLARGHRIQVGEGMIGWSVANARPRVALEVGRDAVRLPTAELPETRSEAAIPLRSRGQVLGALTVQSDQPGAFDEDTITVLQTMADQVAVALDNARLFAESQEVLEAERRAYGEISRQAWSNMVAARTDWGYRYTSRGVFASSGDWPPEMTQALQAGETVRDGDENGMSVIVPVRVRDQVVGALTFRKSDRGAIWTESEVELLETLTDRLGQALESARLYQDTQKRAAREQLISETTARLRESLDLDVVLRTAAREMRQILDLAEAEVRIGTAETVDQTGE